MFGDDKKVGGSEESGRSEGLRGREGTSGGKGLGTRLGLRDLQYSQIRNGF